MTGKNRSSACIGSFMLLPSHTFTRISVHVCAFDFDAPMVEQWGAMVGNAQAKFLDEEGRDVVKALLAPHAVICGEILSSRKGRSSTVKNGWQEVIWLV